MHIPYSTELACAALRLRQVGTPHLTKKFSDEASIHFKKLGKKTMPAGSQSPNMTSIS